MNAFAHLAMLAWPLLAFGLFAFLPARRAIIVGFLAGWSFLPRTGYAIPGYPDYTRMSATCASVLLATLVFRPHRLRAFRLRMIDLVMLLWCSWPFISAMNCGLGPYHGFVASFEQVIVPWGMPYIVGRLYLSDPESVRELAIGIFIVGLVHVPLCLFEARMCPVLHEWVYGRRPGTWRRYAGYGPFCWMPLAFIGQHLALGMFMASASVVGLWLALTGALKRVLNISLGWLVPPLLAATVLCKTMGANVLWVGGLIALWAAKSWRTTLPLVCLLMAPPVYMVLRTTGAWTGAGVVRFLREEVSQRRAESLGTRFENETQLAAKALKKPIFGWGPWGDYRIKDEEGENVSLTDGMWIINLGKYGITGLVVWTLALLLPVASLLYRIPGRYWARPSYAPLAALSTLIAVYAIDCLLNAFVNPVFVLSLGALAGVRPEAFACDREPAGANAALPTVPAPRRGRPVFTGHTGCPCSATRGGARG